MKSHAWSHQRLWKTFYSVAWNLTSPWLMTCTTIKRSVWGKLETLCFLFHTRTQLTYMPHHKMQGCGNSALVVWQKLRKKKKKGYDKIRNRNLESLILYKIFCKRGIFFYTLVSWFGVCGCQFTEINLRVRFAWDLSAASALIMFSLHWVGNIRQLTCSFWNKGNSIFY